MFEQTFKNIDDILHKDAGCTSELDYTEQSSWLLFLKYLDALERDRAMEAELEGRPYAFLLEDAYRWEQWAAPKTKDGVLDHNKAMTGPDLIEFVNGKLFPYLHGFKARASGPQTLDYKIGEIFGEIKNRIQSGYNLRDVINRVDELRFGSHVEKHELSHLYEAKIKNMGNAGRNGGEYYTPRPLIRAMIQVVDPKIGERIYDGACGSAGFLCEAFEYLSKTGKLSTSDAKTLQTRTFYGQEKKSLAYVIGIMNMILHGIEAPNIVHANTLGDNVLDIQPKDQMDVVLANPPFGGKERKEVQQNFPIKTGETAFLFLQHFIRKLKPGGRAAIVIKNTFLSNTDNASVSLRKLLLESCNLHTVLDCPSGTFQGAGVKTVVLFFDKGAPTRSIWYYQLDPGRNMGKTNPLNDADMAEFVALQASFAVSPKSWRVDAAGIDPVSFDLSVKNPDGGEVVVHRSPREILDEIAMLDAESAQVLAGIRALV
ncbi:N-6 DNA methylase [Thermomonas sp.]|uniref:class I SAM-dependent DNA methyltransferase n=1 Tax=Thermomonas sp. TaxID=1971895 RepID=UPI002489E5E5|nr:N-6 DNA methylase [Thermomonas sp.]MDI1252805.1 N-6 DNA methylase [Thermomonas sp.]